MPYDENKAIKTGLAIAGWIKFFFWCLLLACMIESCAMLQSIDATLKRQQIQDAHERLADDFVRAEELAIDAMFGGGYQRLEVE